MAPRTRSNANVSQKLTLSANTCGFSALPNELYLEILSFMPACPIPHDVWVDIEPYPSRQLTLYALSQTSRSLRNFFLKYAWERIEIVEPIQTQKLLKETLRQLETVAVRNPELQQYVTTVSLPIRKYSHQIIIPEVARCLSLLPKLHTLQFFFGFRFSKHEQTIVFSKFRYPSVHTLNLDGGGPFEDILTACPNTRHFSFYKNVGEWTDLQKILNKECAVNIVKLGVALYNQRHITSIVEALPQVRDITLAVRISTRKICVEAFKCLSSLPLHTIRLRMDTSFYSYSPRPLTPETQEGWINLAKEVLAKCPRNGVARKVMVLNADKIVEVYTV